MPNFTNKDVYIFLQQLESKNPAKHKLLMRWLRFYLSCIDNESSYNYAGIPYIRRGQVLLMRMGYNIHNEFRNTHFCVAIRNSSYKNHNVTIVPITSKKHKYGIPIYTELSDCIEDSIREKERSSVWRPLRKLKPVLQEKGISVSAPAIGSYKQVESTFISYINSIKNRLPKTDPIQKNLDLIIIKAHEFGEFLERNPKLGQDSYLLPENLITLSKSRLIVPRKNTHPLYGIKLSDNTLDKLDKEIIKLFTRT